MKPDVKFEVIAAKLLRDLVNEFIFHPADLKITTGRFSNIISLGWVGNRADISRMIGTGGETYLALRDLMRLVGEQHGYEIELTRVGEPTTGKPERYPPFKANPEWPRQRILNLLEATARLGSKSGLVEVSAGDVDADRTGLHVALCQIETLNTETVLARTLKHVFKVIGNANGRVLLVNVERSLAPERQQPASADGRFAKAKP